jgi:hypothetical protein
LEFMDTFTTGISQLTRLSLFVRICCIIGVGIVNLSRIAINPRVEPEI